MTFSIWHSAGKPESYYLISELSFSSNFRVFSSGQTLISTFSLSILRRQGIPHIRPNLCSKLIKLGVIPLVQVIDNHPAVCYPSVLHADT